jgi:hypothetical protein
MLSEDEKAIIEGLDTVVSKTEYYFQLQDLRAAPQTAVPVIMAEIEKLVAKINEALVTLKKNLAKDSDPYAIDTDISSIELPY